MKGDKLVITEEHTRAARKIAKLLFPPNTRRERKFILTIAGESGSGKSEIASALSEWLSHRGIKSMILQQDDYFVYPPKTNAGMRRKDIRHVGLQEVRLDLLDQNLVSIMEGSVTIDKPLVIFDEDRITQETVSLDGVGVVIVEGTYTTVLKHTHQRVFIDRTFLDTRETRKKRAREEQDRFLEEILQIEHRIISSHLPQATIIVTRDYDVREVERHRGTEKRNC
jgi:uridine kinase